MAGNGTVEPRAVWHAWGHVVPGGTVETVVGSVITFEEAATAALVSLELAASYGEGEVGDCWRVHVSARV